MRTIILESDLLAVRVMFTDDMFLVTLNEEKK